MIEIRRVLCDEYDPAAEAVQTRLKLKWAKLQYRYQRPDMSDFAPELRWSEWQDVKIVEAE